MTVKTYARARVAKAALRAIAEGAEIETYEPEAGRFSARAIFAAAPAADVLAAIEAAGFTFEVPADDEKTAAEVLDDEIAAVREEDAPAEVENPADVPLAPARKSRYVNEISGFAGVVDYVRGRIPELVEQGLGRTAIIEQLRSEGVAYGTARTQYQKWFAARKAI